MLPKTKVIFSNKLVDSLIVNKTLNFLLFKLLLIYYINLYYSSEFFFKIFSSNFNNNFTTNWPILSDFIF